MPRRLRLLRRLFQVLSFLLFLWLLGKANYGLFHAPSSPPVDSFLRLDPLLAISGLVSLREWSWNLALWAVPVLVLTLLLGRVFCGWVCPMGTAIDLAERAFPAKKDARVGPGWKRIKFYLLIGVLASALMAAGYRFGEGGSLRSTVGLSAAYLLDPIVIITRTLVLAVVAPVHWLLGLLGEWAAPAIYGDFAASHPRLQAGLYRLGEWLQAAGQPLFFRMGLVALLIFLALLGLSRLTRRFWCRHLCPLGALLGFTGRFSPVRLAVNEKCNKCLRCVQACKMGAIGEDPTSYSSVECIYCYTCVSVCPQGAIYVTARPGHPGRVASLDLPRRRLLHSLAAGIGFAALMKTDWGAKRTDAAVVKVSGAALLRPPGARAEEEFVTACVRCGECMKVCPTNGLQPALAEGGLEAFWTPVLVPRIGPCTRPCNLCGEVCPTDAIRPFTTEEKPYLFLGTALIDRSTCIAWRGDGVCLVCDEACSYDAVYQETENGQQRPLVDKYRCVGCGLCENKCPIQPVAAIRVYPFGDKRHQSRRQQQDWLRQSPREAAGEVQYH
jgi:MauM/NapG family ferredoxin protein